MVIDNTSTIDRGTSPCAGVYVHIPFCVSKCAYCDFVSDKYSHDVQARYVQELCKEIDKLAMHNANTCIDTIYIGGGTPSSLYSGGIQRIVEHLMRALYIQSTIELTIECNPESVTVSKIQEWRDVGINRVSIGLQSANNRILSNIGRAHTVEMFDIAMERLAQYFDNISIDMMYGLPTQSIDDIERTLEHIISHKPKHISAYALEVERGTSIYKDIKLGNYVLPSEDTVASQYDYIVQTLAKYGYNRYEVSNFAINGYHSRHNIKYWNDVDYYGFGVAAHSKVGMYRYQNTGDIYKYIGDKPCSSTQSKEKINDHKRHIEFFMLGFRQTKGISVSQYESMFGIKLWDKYASILDMLLDKGIIILEGDNIRIADNKMLLLNDIICRFI